MFTARFPSSCEPTLCLLRRRVRLSREVTDDVVRARGSVEKHAFTDGLVSWFDDKRHGLARWWRENNTLSDEVPFFDDKRHGLERWWHENGTLWAEIPYVDGKKHGLARWWRTNGILWEEISYIDDKQVSYKTNNAGK